MIRGLYIAGTGMLAQRSKMDVVTNNIANVETLGFKQDVLVSRSFEDMLLSRMDDPSIVNTRTEVGSLAPGIHVDEVSTEFGQGTPEQTNISTDMCIIGEGFFVVNTEDGELYTRAGNFTLDAEGYLLDANGYRVQSQNGDIQLTSDRFLVTEEGAIYDLDTNNEVARMRIVEFEDTGALRKQGDNLYAGDGAADAANSSILQGYIESSNVNVAREMVDMIITSRAYESNQRSARMIDQTLDKAVNEIARF